MTELFCVLNYLRDAVFSSDARLSASHVFSPWTLKNAEHPEGGGSLDAIWKQVRQHHSVRGQSRAHAFKLEIKSPPVPAGRSALLQSRLWGRGQTSACSSGRSWARHWLSSRSGHSRLDLCLCGDTKTKGTCHHCVLFTSLMFFYSAHAKAKQNILWQRHKRAEQHHSSQPPVCILLLA